ncbi:MAG TPA: hypothetical protein VGH28_30510 [Polyangiaceae bacterium]|jgi:hypothetical protein
MSDHGTLVAERYGVTRSTKWPSVERAHLARSPECVACRRPGARVAVHHIFPFHICVLLGRPDLELDTRNLITLCAESDERGAGDHHLLIGHFDDWESMNVHVGADARERFHGMTAVQLRASEAWRKLVAGRPIDFSQMSAKTRRAVQEVMNRELPQAGRNRRQRA